MKVLIVASGNSPNISPFVKEQADSLRNLGCHIDYFLIKGKGIWGYLKNYFLLIRILKKDRCYDIIHAHYGLSGLLATLQPFIPVVITFHGSDVNLSKSNYLLSRLASRLSTTNIFVHENLPRRLKYFSFQPNIIPCGVNLDLFRPIPKLDARKKLGLDNNYKYILFSSSFDNKIKNAPLAKSAIAVLTAPTVDSICVLKVSSIVDIPAAKFCTPSETAVPALAIEPARGFIAPSSLSSIDCRILISSTAVDIVLARALAAPFIFSSIP